MPFRLESARIPSGIRYIDVTDSALNAVQSSAVQAMQAEKSGGTCHLDRYRFLTADRRETTGNGGGSAR